MADGSPPFGKKFAVFGVGSPPNNRPQISFSRNKAQKTQSLLQKETEET